jgi:copper(I)-binding protein
VIRSSRRGILPRSIVIVAAVALGPVIAGCEAGNDAPTLNWHQPTDGTFQAVGKHLTISNAFVLGAPIGRALNAGQNAGVYLGIVNTGTPDRLLAIKAPGIAQKVLLPGHGIPLRTSSRVLLSGPAPTIVLQHLLKPLAGGTVIVLYLKFQNAGSTKLYVPVMPRASNYATFSPPALSPSASASASAGQPGKAGSGSPTPSPSTSP